MPTKGPNEFFGGNETEHLLSRELFKGHRGDVLRGLGFKENAMGNRRSLFISSEITDRFVGQDNNPYTKALKDSGWGTVLHRGGDNSVGGFQAGKNNFQIDLVESWIARSELAPEITVTVH